MERYLGNLMKSGTTDPNTLADKLANEAINRVPLHPLLNIFSPQFYLLIFFRALAITLQ